jgi:hypothetical protein
MRLAALTKSTAVLFETSSRAHGIGLRYRKQLAKVETMTGPVGNRVGIGRDMGTNKKEGACHSLASWEKDNERMVRVNGPLQGPSGIGEWFTGHKREVVRRTGKEIYAEKLDGIT